MKTLRNCKRVYHGFYIRNSQNRRYISGIADVGEPQVRNLHSLLQLCAKIRAPTQGKAGHAQVICFGLEPDIFTSNMLINMYSKCGLIKDARKLFDEMPERSLVSWNMVIGSLTQNGDDQEALTLLIHMQRQGTPFNEFTISSVICGCASRSALFECTQLHACAVKAAVDSNVFVGTALLDVYAKCGLIKDAGSIFESMQERSVVTLSSMMAGYVQNELYEEAFALFRNTHGMGFELDQFIISSAVCACAGLAVLIEGSQMHAISCKTGYFSNIYITSTLLDMYAKCGCIGEAYLLFQDAEARSIVLWNAMISGFAKSARSLEAIVLFEKMQQIGLNPNEVTYVSVLSACSHMGLPETGKKYFDLMKREQNISPSALHYSCLIDILGRAGLVQEAHDLIQQIPCSATPPMWGSILASCRTHSNIEVAEVAMKHLVEMEPENAGNFVLLSDTYAANKMWEEVARTRKIMRESDIKKERGKSWIEIKSEVHSFMVGERNHPRIAEIYSRLDNLLEELKKLDYKVDTTREFHDVEESRKEELLRHHSEKLALTFGLMCLPHDVPIRIMKNLRICGDCHFFMKVASKHTRRLIIVRDTNRFHHFKDGFCSCGEFW